MNRYGMNRGAMLSAAAVCLIAALAARPASAATRLDFGVGVVAPGPVYVAPAPVYVAPVCEGHYETRVERVLVAPERSERRWSQPAYETRYYNGQPQTVCVNQGGWRDYVCPAQYENRTVQVWVPGCCATTYYAPAPRYVAPSVGFGLDFNYRSGRR